jgi:hypothetical protein
MLVDMGKEMGLRANQLERGNWKDHRREERKEGDKSW